MSDSPMKRLRGAYTCLSEPARWPRLIDCSAQCIVKLEVTRIAVLTPATNTGKWYGSGGHSAGALGLTTLTKK